MKRGERNFSGENNRRGNKVTLEVMGGDGAKWTHSAWAQNRRRNRGDLEQRPVSKKQPDFGPQEGGHPLALGFPAQESVHLHL